MPEYIYQHPESQEYVSIFQGIHATHEYIDQYGTKWNRIFTTPQLNCVGTIDPFSKNDFVNKTASTKGTYGDLADRSAELSAQRKAQLGYDPVQNKYFDDYSKKRKGVKHPKDKRGNDSQDYKVDY